MQQLPRAWLCNSDVRNALLRDVQGKPASPLGVVLDLVAEHESADANPGVSP
jgi:hypothetical protein